MARGVLGTLDNRPMPGLQVWQDIAKPQILRVQPFEPYRQAAAAGMNKVSDLVRLRYEVRHT